jgi:membrane protein DedA with SNARE-associated domain
MPDIDSSSLLWLQQLIQAYGLGALFIIVMLECLGIPVPGETALVATALYAGSTHHFSVIVVVLVAAAAAILGDNIGYLIGRSVGIPLIIRYGRYVRLNEPRLKVGQYLFLKHGGKIVFFGRFIAILRTYSALLAGVNLMGWPHFLVMNALGGICWASVFGFGAYFLGHHFTRIASPVAFVLLIGAIALIAGSMYFFRNHEKKIEQRAAQALVGSWPHSGPRSL